MTRLWLKALKPEIELKLTLAEDLFVEHRFLFTCVLSHDV